MLRALNTAVLLKPPFLSLSLGKELQKKSTHIHFTSPLKPDFLSFKVILNNFSPGFLKSFFFFGLWLPFYSFQSRNWAFSEDFVCSFVLLTHNSGLWIIQAWKDLRNTRRTSAVSTHNTQPSIKTRSLYAPCYSSLSPRCSLFLFLKKYLR